MDKIYSQKEYEKIMSKFDKKKDKAKNQSRTRKKYERIRCPDCGSISKPLREYWGGHQVRKCRNGHKFTYNYTIQAMKQWKFNYKVKI